MKSINFLFIIIFSLLAVPSMGAAVSGDVVSSELYVTVDSVEQVADTLAGTEILAENDTADVVNAVSDSTIVAQPDSVAVDANSAAKANVADPAEVDSLVKSIMAKTVIKVNTNHFNLKPISDEDKARFISRYSKSIRENAYSDSILNVCYDDWRRVFVGSDNRSLDLYIDGIEMIMGSLRVDTMLRRGDRINYLKEELMELYELAVDNVHFLNSQIDTERSADTLTVASLRASQLNWYIDVTIMDSIMQHTPANVLGDVAKENEHWSKILPANTDIKTYWRNKLFESQEDIFKMYAIASGFLYAEEANIYAQDLVLYGNLMRHRAGAMQKIINNEYIPAYRDKGLFFPRSEVLKSLNALYNEEIDLLKEKGLDVLQYVMSSADIPADEKEQHRLNLIAEDKDGRSVAGGVELVRYEAGNPVKGKFELDQYFADSPEEIEKIYAQRVANNGGVFTQEIMDEVLANNTLKRYNKSEVYYNAMRAKYAGEEMFAPYEDICEMASRARTLGKVGDFISLTEIQVVQPEFMEEGTPFSRAQTFFLLANENKKNKRANACRQHLMNAINTCPDYADPYYLMGNLAHEQLTYKNYALVCGKYEIIIDEWYSKAMQYTKNCPEEYKLLLANENTISKAIEGLRSYIRQCISDGELFSYGISKSNPICDYRLLGVKGAPFAPYSSKTKINFSKYF